VPTPLLAWTSDSKWLIVPDRPSPSQAFGLVLLSVEDGEKRPLTKPPPQYWADGSPAVSPDGRTVAFARSPTLGIADIYLLALSDDFAPQGEPKQLTSDHNWLANIMWVPGGRAVLYMSLSGVNRVLNRVSVSGPRPIRATPLAITLGSNAMECSAALSPKGDRLVYSESSGGNPDVWRLELAGPGQNFRPLEMRAFP
jgi:Tol biopolymer transport system component